MTTLHSAESNLTGWLKPALLSWLIVTGFLILAEYKPTNWQSFMVDRRHHLGAEYNCIAKAIYKGRGFSDPFHEETGPTAWMPPVLPYMMAAVYWLSNDDASIVIESMLMLHAVAVWSAGCIVIREAMRLRVGWGGCIVFIVAVMANFNELMMKTHDTGLLLLVVNALFLGILKCRAGMAMGWAALWGAFGGFCALCSPVIGMAWAILTVKRLQPRPNAPTSQSPPRPLIVAAVVSIVVIAPWMIRNRLTFGNWIPIKSNAMYELWQSQCNDSDGVLDSLTLREQPWASAGIQRIRYAEAGEMQFIAEKGSEAKHSIISMPTAYLKRATNRLVEATLLYDQFRGTATNIGFNWLLLLKRLIFPMPLLGVLFILWRSRAPMPVEAANAILIACLVLLPYVLISYYDRYATPVIGMKMLIVVYTLHLLFLRHGGTAPNQSNFWRIQASR